MRLRILPGRLRCPPYGTIVTIADMSRHDDLSDRGGSNPAKGLPFRLGEVIGTSIFDGGAAFPVAVLHQSAIEHNSRTMMSYCEQRNVSLAPHGKTTMAPAIFRRQIADGCWAITAATAWQAKTMREAGVHRVLIANQVVVRAEIEWLSEALDDGFEIMCYVDSLDGVRIIENVFNAVGASRPLPVLVELGVPQGRTGTRTVQEGLTVAEAVVESSHLTLAGIAGFEGILGAEGDRTAADVVCEFLDRIVEFVHVAGQKGLFDPSREVIVTAGGSAYFDHVVDRFSLIDLDQPIRIVIRSGGYISHDDVGLHRVSPLGEHPRIEHVDRLRPAIEVWGAVLSRPEPTRALVGIGKRDASPDGRLPIAKKVRRRGAKTVETIDPIQVVSLNDQHAYLDVTPDARLDVGDLVGFGIGHPCTTFDKWRVLLMVDDDYRVTELVDTLF